MGKGIRRILCGIALNLSGKRILHGDNLPRHIFDLTLICLLSAAIDGQRGCHVLHDVAGHHGPHWIGAKESTQLVHTPTLNRTTHA